MRAAVCRSSVRQFDVHTLISELLCVLKQADDETESGLNMSLLLTDTLFPRWLRNVLKLQSEATRDKQRGSKGQQRPSHCSRCSN